MAGCASSDDASQEETTGRDAAVSDRALADTLAGVSSRRATRPRLRMLFIVGRVPARTHGAAVDMTDDPDRGQLPSRQRHHR